MSKNSLTRAAKISLYILTALLLGAAGAEAKDRDHGWEGDRGDHESEYERPRHKRHHHDRRPIYIINEYHRHENVERPAPQYYEPARRERVVVCRETVQTRRNTAPIFIGSMVGGLVGHQMSEGDEAATAMGAVVGTLVGYEVSRESRTQTATTWQPCR